MQKHFRKIIVISLVFSLGLILMQLPECVSPESDGTQYQSISFDYLDGVSSDRLVRSELTEWKCVCTEPFPIYTNRTEKDLSFRFIRERVLLNGKPYGLIIRNEDDLLRNLTESSSISFFMVFGRIARSVSKGILNSFSNVKAITYFSPTQEDIDSLTAMFPRLEVLDLWMDYFPIRSFGFLQHQSKLKTLALRCSNHIPFDEKILSGLNSLEYFSYSCALSDVAIDVDSNPCVKVLKIESYELQTIEIMSLGDPVIVELNGSFCFSKLTEIPQGLRRLRINDPNGITVSSEYVSGKILFCKNIAELLIDTDVECLEIPAVEILAGVDLLKINGMTIRERFNEKRPEGGSIQRCVFQSGDCSNVHSTQFTRDRIELEKLLPDGYLPEYACCGVLDCLKLAKILKESPDSRLSQNAVFISDLFLNVIDQEQIGAVLSSKSINTVILHIEDNLPEALECYLERGKGESNKNIETLVLSNVSIFWEWWKDSLLDQLLTIFPGIQNLIIAADANLHIGAEQYLAKTISKHRLKTLRLILQVHEEEYDQIRDFLSFLEPGREMFPGIEISIPDNIEKVFLHCSSFPDSFARILLSASRLKALSYMVATKYLQRLDITFSSVREENARLESRSLAYFGNRTVYFRDRDTKFKLEYRRLEVSSDQALNLLQEMKNLDKVSFSRNIWDNISSPFPESITAFSNVFFSPTGFNISKISANSASLFMDETRLLDLGCSPEINLEITGKVFGDLVPSNSADFNTLVLWDIPTNADIQTGFFTGNTPLLYYWRNLGLSRPSFRQDYYIQHYLTHRPKAIFYNSQEER